jgi:type 1 fimbria pilin
MFECLLVRPIKRGRKQYCKSVSAKIKRASAKSEGVHALVSFISRSLLLFPLSLAFSCPVLAGGSITCNTGNTNLAINAGTVVIPMNAPPGTVVSTLAPATLIMNCRFVNQAPYTVSGFSTNQLEVTAALAPGFNDVYVTGIQGLGIRYTFNSSACNTSNATMANNLIRIPCPIAGPLGGPYVPQNIYATVSFVIYGPVSSGGVSIQTLPVMSQKYEESDDPGHLWGQPNAFSGSATGVLMAATCSVQTANLAVQLPTPAVRAFAAGLGTVAGRTGFDLSFNCSSGAQVSIVLTDVVAPENRTNILTITPDSTAKGVAVQVLKGDGTPVMFGPDAVGTSVANQWWLGTSPNGVMVVPLSAQYIRTGTVVPGSIRALATFTLSYN